MLSRFESYLSHVNNKYTQANSMWKSFDDLASRMDIMETKGLNFLSQQQEMDRIRDAFAPLSRKYLPDKKVEFNFTKKEEPVSTFNLVMSAEKLAVYIQDLQELAPDSKTKYDKNGNTVYNPETGDYEKIDIPLEDRWISLGEMRVNEDGTKFVVKSSSATLAKMEALHAQRARIASYQS